MGSRLGSHLPLMIGPLMIGPLMIGPLMIGTVGRCKVLYGGKKRIRPASRSASGWAARSATSRRT